MLQIPNWYMSIGMLISIAAAVFLPLKKKTRSAAEKNSTVGDSPADVHIQSASLPENNPMPEQLKPIAQPQTAQDTDRVVEAINELKYSLKAQKEMHDVDLEKIRKENEELRAMLTTAQAERDRLAQAANETAQRIVQDKMTIVNAEMLTIDLMEGHDFEKWCADTLNDIGYQNVSVTPGSGDQGVDIVAEKDGLKYAVQCKRYNSDLGNTPVQEVFTGARFYNCHVGVVMTNRNFTTGAKDAAAATGVLLWGRSWILQYLYKKHGVMPEADPIS